MLTSIDIVSAETRSLQIGGAQPEDELILKSVSNLSSAKVDQYKGDFAREGGYYQGRRAQPLNPVFTFKIRPDYFRNREASDIREEVYRMFMEPARNSDSVRVVLYDDRREPRMFDAYTESIEAEIFSKQMEVQVSMLTVDPYIRALDSFTVEEAPGRGWLSYPIRYQGSAKTGISARLRIKEPTATVTLANGLDRMVFNDSFGAFAKGQAIYVNTNPGSKLITYALQTRMGLLTSYSTWITLTPSVGFTDTNLIKAYGSTEGDGKAVIELLSYRAAYWGI